MRELCRRAHTAQVVAAVQFRRPRALEARPAQLQETWVHDDFVGPSHSTGLLSEECRTGGQTA